MKTSPFALLLAVVAFVPIHEAVAQSPEMPEPLAVVVDADGKPMVQVVSFSYSSILVLFDFEGEPASFELLDEYSDFDSYGKLVYFSLDNCQGEVYLSDNISGPLERLNQRAFVISGPDGDDGSYRVFRSTSVSAATVFPESRMAFGTSTLGYCTDEPGIPRNLLPGEEILPNPLEGFHGPTVANPDRLLTVKGGTRLP